MHAQYELFFNKYWWACLQLKYLPAVQILWRPDLFRVEN